MFHTWLHLGKYGQWFVAIMTALCPLTCGQFFAWPAAALPLINNGSAGFSLSETEAAWMVTIAFAGNIVSPVPSGLLMDKIGRRNTVSIGLLIAIATWMIKAFLRDVTSLLIARFLCGFWSGVVYTVIPAFMGEVVHPKIRGRMGALFGVNLYLGALYESLASFTSYRNLSLISAVAPVLVFVGFLFLPESPYYYLRKGNREKAKTSILWLQGKCNDDDLDVLQAKVEEQLRMKGTFCDIFKTKGSRKAFIIIEVLQGIQRFSGVTFLFAYTTVVLPDSWVTAEQSFLVLTLVWIVFSLLSSSFIDKFNRRLLLAISCLGSGLGMGGATIWYYLRDFSNIDTSTTNYLPLVFLIISGMFYSMGIVSIPTLVQAELYPVNLKSIGSAVACISASVFSAIGTRFFYDINDAIGVYFNFLIMCVAPLICVIFIFTVMVETKGKSLEVIQDILNGTKIVEPVLRNSTAIARSAEDKSRQ